MQTGVELDVDLALARFDLSVRLHSDAPTIGLVGPSGSGKTTLLNLIAGTARPDRGLIRVGAHVFADTARGVWVPPYRRRIGYVFQDGRLFPHLSVQQNLNYGRLFAGGRRPAVPPERIVEILGIGPLLPRRAVGLSGGEQQRIAIGRAFFAAPRLLLMDEPLASLDAQRRTEILPLIEQVRREADIPLIYVSHTESEITRLADEIVTVEAGRLVGRRGRAAAGPDPEFSPAAR